jgi:hypothetical protein
LAFQVSCLPASPSFFKEIDMSRFTIRSIPVAAALTLAAALASPAVFAQGLGVGVGAGAGVNAGTGA